MSESTKPKSADSAEQPPVDSAQQTSKALAQSTSSDALEQTSTGLTKSTSAVIFKPHVKEIISDKEIPFETKISDNVDDFRQKRLERVFANRVTFYNVTFKQSVITDCYFRNCKFVQCDFTGTKFSDSNFQGSKFHDCVFEYAFFERTLIEDDILEHNLPKRPNLAQHLVRSLRVNYQSLGDYDGVNAAIRVELEATLEHYRNAVFSSEDYYRNKYREGASRYKYIAKYIVFYALHLLWGNGERPLRLIIASAIIWVVGVLLGITAYDLSVLEAMKASITTVLLGSGLDLGTWGGALFTLVRYVFIGLFVASLVKRLMRR